MQGLRPATEAYALLIARRVRERLGATWGLGETGATGPSGNRYGDPAGHSCMAIAGPIERAITLQTGSADRRANMDAFAKRALDLLLELCLIARRCVTPVVPAKAATQGHTRNPKTRKNWTSAFAGMNEFGLLRRFRHFRAHLRAQFVDQA